MEYPDDVLIYSIICVSEVFSGRYTMYESFVDINIWSMIGYTIPSIFRRELYLRRELVMKQNLYAHT